MAFVDSSNLAHNRAMFLANDRPCGIQWRSLMSGFQSLCVGSTKCKELIPRRDLVQRVKIPAVNTAGAGSNVVGPVILTASTSRRLRRLVRQQPTRHARIMHCRELGRSLRSIAAELLSRSYHFS